jgi:hypothetical protein
MLYTAANAGRNYVLVSLKFYWKFTSNVPVYHNNVTKLRVIHRHFHNHFIVS